MRATENVIRTVDSGPNKILESSGDHADIYDLNIICIIHTYIIYCECGERTRCLQQHDQHTYL